MEETSSIERIQKKMSVEEALKSNDLNKVKGARASAKTQVTQKINALSPILKVEEVGFKYETLDRSQLTKDHAKLVEWWENLKKLHERCCELSKVESVSDLDQYIEDIRGKVDPLLEKWEKFIKLPSIEASDSIEEKEEAHEEAKAMFQLSLEEAQKITKITSTMSASSMIDSEEILLHPAERAARSLEEDFEIMRLRADDLKAAMKAKGDDAAQIKSKTSYLDAKKSV